MKWGAGKTFNLWFGIILLFLVIIVIISFITANQLIKYDNQVKGSNEILLGLENIFSSLKDAETSVRGYVITDEESYLVPYRNATKSINQHIKRIQRLLPDDPNLKSKLDGLESLISERLDLIDETIDLRENYGFQAAQKLIKNDKGKKLSEDIREVIIEIEIEENKLLERLLKDRNNVRNMIYVNGFGILIAIVFACLSIFTINRYITERKMLYEKSQKQAEELRLLYQDQNQRSRDLEILNNVNQVVHKSLRLDEVYNVALDSVMGLENVDMAMIYLVDKNTNEVVLEAHRNVPEDYLKKATRIPYPKGLTWKVIESGEITNIEDAQKDPNLGPAGKELGHHSMLGIPVFQEGKVIGLVWLLSYNERIFNEREVNLLSTLGNQIAIAVAKAKLYKDLLDANEKLRELDDMKDEFISIASHELRTPLSAIGGYIDMLMEGDFGELSPEITLALTKVSTGTKRLIDLVKSMLDISRIEQGRLEFNISTFDLCDVCQEVINTLMPIAQEKGIKLEYRQPTGAEKPLVSADEDRVGQVLINLVGNAIQFTEIGGVVISHRFEYKKIVTDVVDTGVGIPTQTREILFKKFLIVRRSLTRNYQEGTGLGLYISRLLMREMGGDVWLERSELEHGSTFSFSLPRAEDPMV